MKYNGLWSLKTKLIRASKMSQVTTFPVYSHTVWRPYNQVAKRRCCQGSVGGGDLVDKKAENRKKIRDLK